MLGAGGGAFSISVGGRGAPPGSSPRSCAQYTERDSNERAAQGLRLHLPGETSKASSPSSALGLGGMAGRRCVAEGGRRSIENCSIQWLLCATCGRRPGSGRFEAKLQTGSTLEVLLASCVATARHWYKQRPGCVRCDSLVPPTLTRPPSADRKAGEAAACMLRKLSVLAAALRCPPHLTVNINNSWRFPIP